MCEETSNQCMRFVNHESTQEMRDVRKGKSRDLKLELQSSHEEEEKTKKVRKNRTRLYIEKRSREIRSMIIIEKNIDEAQRTISKK
jgi:hypothetical protein